MNRTVIAAAAAGVALLASQAIAQTAAPKVIGVSKAVAAAETAVGGRAYEAELDNDRSGLVYEINLVKDGRAIEAEIDAVTGKLVRESRPLSISTPFAARDLRAVQTAPRTLSQTIAAVEASTKGRVTEVGLDRRAGRHVYEIELAGAQDREVMVDLVSGAISPVLDD